MCLVARALAKGYRWSRDTHVIKTGLTKARYRTRWSMLCLELLDMRIARPFGQGGGQTCVDWGR